MLMLLILHTQFETRLFTCAPERKTSSKQIAHRKLNTVNHIDNMRYISGKKIGKVPFLRVG